MNSYFSLDIGDSRSNHGDQISTIMGLKSNNPDSGGSWSYRIECNDVESIDFANEFTKLLDDKYDNLASIGIMKEDIIVWFVYYYEYQCNMEFTPQQLKLLGDNGITFCISCYDVGEYSDDDES